MNFNIEKIVTFVLVTPVPVVAEPESEPLPESPQEIAFIPAFEPA